MLVAVKAIITAYCWCVICTGHTHGITKSGRPARAGITVACDKKLLNKTVYIKEVGIRQCDDTGSAITGTRIDVYFDSHEEALKFGVKRLKVYHPRVERKSWRKRR